MTVRSHSTLDPNHISALSLFLLQVCCSLVLGFCINITWHIEFWFLCGELSYDFNFLAFVNKKLSAISYHKKEKAVVVAVSLEDYE